MSDFKLMLESENLYYFKKIDHSKANVFYLNKINKQWKIIKKILTFFYNKLKLNRLFKNLNYKFCLRYYGNEIIKSIKQKELIAFMDSTISIELLNFIKLYGDFDKCLLVLWNEKNDNEILEYKKYFKNNIFSYSQKNCNRFSLHHYNDFILTDLKPNISEIKYDFYFLGRDKNRLEEFIKFLDLIQDTSYRKCIDIYVDTPHKIDSRINYFNKYMSYDDYLEKVFESKCLLDFTSTSNITFRTIEAFVFNKKYITNNKIIKKMDFYNENNILIFDEKTNLNDIKEFLEKPLVKINDSIIEKYDFYYNYNMFKNYLEVINNK